MSTFKRLENWVGGHKCRAVQIDIDDGYGASRWHVKLWEGKRKFEALEVNFFLIKKEDIPPDMTYVVFVDDEGDEGDEDCEAEDWPGLEATINAAIDLAEKNTNLQIPQKTT